MTIAVRGTGEAVEAQLEEDEFQMLWLNSPNRVTGKRQGRCLLTAVLKMGGASWRARRRTGGSRARVAGGVARRSSDSESNQEGAMNYRAIPSLFLASVLAVTARSGVVTSAQTSANQRVVGERIVANLWLPTGKRPYAGVLVVGGSGGGIAWQDYWADILAKQGFAALALAYFGMEGLPKELDEIPLEYFLGALEYMQRKPEIDRTRIGIVGVSKGAELALLLASHAPAIRAVVAFVPSSVVFQSSASMETGQKPRSSWTFHGRPLPFVPRESGNTEEPLVNEFRRALKQRDRVTNATIPVERIHGPILLLSGKEDMTWPSSDMSEMVIARLRERNFRFAYQHFAYDDAGHMIHQRRSDAVKRGGTERGNNFAQQDAERRTLAFLAERVGAGGNRP